VASPDIERIQDLGKGWLKEAEELRALQLDDDPAPPGIYDPDAPRPQVNEALVMARACLDRLETIFAQASVLKSGADAKARDLAEKYEDKLDESIRDRAKRAREFEGARERLADANLAALKERAAARDAAKAADLAAGVERLIRLRYYGLVKLRDELADRLKNTAWESNLDR
jgi:hypothetical protein